MGAEFKTSASDAKPAARPQRHRWQFSLLSLFLLTTLTCLVLSWWAWPRPAEVVAIVNAMSTPLPVSSSLTSNDPPEFVICRNVLLNNLHDPEVLKDAVSIPGNGNLRMFRDRSEPAKWLEARLRIESVPPSVVIIRMKVPAQFREEAVEVVDYITTRCVSRTLVEVGRRTREHASVLLAEKNRVERKLKSASRRLEKLRRMRAAENPELVALEAEILKLTDLSQQLTAELLAAHDLDNSSKHLQLVQMATVTNGNQ
jgi:hypothetical protein